MGRIIRLAGRGEEDDPELCAEALLQTVSVSDQAGEPDVSVLFNRTGAFSAHTFDEDPAELDAASFSVAFTSSRTASGSYSASYEYEDMVYCTGAGPFALTLSQPTPPLAPVEPPPRGQRPVPGQTNPGDRCAMRFQIQQGKNTPHSLAVPSPRPITVTEALTGLDALQSEVPRRMRRASERAFTKTRDWVIARPPHGVSGSGNVKREFFDYEKKNWRLDTENERCTNLTS